MAYYIGVDGGGTKTLFALAGEDMEIIAAHTCAGGSYKDKGVAAVVDMLHGGVLRLLSESSVVPSIAIGDIAGICFGLPCFGESAEGDRLLSAELNKRFWGTPISVVNDSEVGWAGSLGMNPGVNIVAGTGSIAFGRDASGRTARCGGWSEFFSDEGSCYWLGRKTMGLFSKQADGRLPKNALYDIIREAFSLEEDFAFIDVMEDVTIKHRDKVASMQMLLMRAALSGDGSARDLYVQAAGELAATVAGVAGRLELPPPFPVSYSGGLFKAGDLIMEPFAAKITALGGYLQAPLFSPEYGALLLARERFKSA